MSAQRPNKQPGEGSTLPQCSISPVADTATPGRAPWSIRKNTPSQASAWMMPPNTSLPTQIGDPIVYLSPLTRDQHGVCRNRHRLSLPCSAVPYTIDGERPGHWSQAPIHGPLATHYGRLPPTPLGQFYGCPSSQPVPSLQMVPIHPPGQGQSHLPTFRDGTGFNSYNHATSASIPLAGKGPTTQTIPVPQTSGNHIVLVLREAELQIFGTCDPMKGSSATGTNAEATQTPQVSSASSAAKELQYHPGDPAQARTEDILRGSFFQPLEMLEERVPIAQTIPVPTLPGNHMLLVPREVELHTIQSSPPSSGPLSTELVAGNLKTCKASSNSYLARTSNDFLGNPTVPQSEHKMKSSHQELEMLTEAQPLAACPPVYSADSSSPETIQITEHLAPQGGDAQEGIMLEACLQSPPQVGDLMIGLEEFPDFEELISSMEPLLPDSIFSLVDPSEPSEWIIKKCPEEEAVENPALSRGIMGGQSLDIVGFSSRVPKKVISEDSETSLCPPSVTHISPIIDLFDLKEEPQRLNKVSGIPIKRKLLSSQCLPGKKLPQRSDGSQLSKERSAPMQISMGPSDPDVSTNRKRKNIPSNKQEPLMKIPKTNIISDPTTAPGTSGLEWASGAQEKEGSADKMGKKGRNQMPTKSVKHSSQKDVTGALKITMRNLEASSVSSEVSPTKEKIPAVERQKEVDPGSSSCKLKSLKTKAKDPKPDKKQSQPHSQEKAKVSMSLPGIIRGKKKATKAAAEEPSKPIPRSHLALHMMESVHIFHPLGTGKLPPAPLKKQLPLVTPAPVKPLPGMGTLGRTLSSLPRIPKLSASSSGSQQQHQSSSKPVPASRPMPIQRPAHSTSVLSCSYDQKPSSSQMYQTSGWRPQANAARKLTGPIPHPPMAGQKQWRPCITQSSTVVVHHPVEPPASPPYIGDTFIPWRTPPDDLEVSDPITEEQWPIREMMKRQAQREREEAAHWTSVGRVKYFVEREKEMDISIAYGYPCH